MTTYFPDPSVFPSSEWRDKLLWIELEPRKIEGQSTATDPTTVSLSRITSADAEVYRFLAPEELQENIQHTWEPLENIASKLSQKIQSTARNISQEYENFKLDTPLLYKDSNRRTFSFLFQLGVSKTSGDLSANAKQQVTDPVKNLMKWSSPSLMTGTENILDTIELPYLFGIKSIVGSTQVDLINIRAAAITDIQPVYHHPYFGGYPCRCDLTVTFTDIEPLDKGRSFEKNITVTGS